MLGFILLGAVFLVVSTVLVYEGDGGAFSFILMVMGVMFFFLAWHETWPETKVADQAKQYQEARALRDRETPRVIREVDGCKVYQFEVDKRSKFFTRCPDKTTTDWEYQKSCGKGCSKTIQESVETSNVKP